MAKKTYVTLILSAAALTAAIVGVGVLMETKPTPPRRDVQQTPRLVRAIRLEPHDVVESLEGYGTAQADRYARVSAEAAGQVVYVSEALRPGAPAHAHDVLVRIDDREYQAALARSRAKLANDAAALDKLVTEENSLKHLIEIAQAELEIAEREMDRVQRLHDAGSAGQRELDVARTQLEAQRRQMENLKRELETVPDTRRQLEAAVVSSQADVAVAELNVERCTIAAPFDGRIEEVNVELGERVALTADWIFSIMEPNVIEVPIEIPMSWYPRIEQGAACRLSLESDANVIWTGQVARIAPSGDSAMRTLAVYVVVDNRQQQTPLKPGVFVHAEMTGQRHAEALTVPRGAVQDGWVFVEVDGLVQKRAVTVVRNIRDDAIVTGLSAGDVVITSNLDALVEGEPVRVEIEASAGEPAAARHAETPAAVTLAP